MVYGSCNYRDGTRVYYLPYSIDPDFYQPIRIFHARYRKSLLARLSLAPWRPPRDIHLLPLIILLLLLISIFSIIDRKASCCVYTTNNGNSTILFPFRVVPVLVDICSTCHGRRARDLRETRIYTVLENRRHLLSNNQ